MATANILRSEEGDQQSVYNGMREMVSCKGLSLLLR